MSCASLIREDDIMGANTFELPLAFQGHTARLEVTHLENGAWLVQTKVDGRVLGWERLTRHVQVDRYRARVQQWLAQAEASERRRVPAA
jgi:hypothetical protein